ncbi:hypothetical protein [Microtetraspora sp. NBRC 13810]|nr:hypothetical protein [Microtetraspora sp. NBRC 13810]
MLSLTEAGRDGLLRRLRLGDAFDVASSCTRTSPSALATGGWYAVV